MTVTMPAVSRSRFEFLLAGGQVRYQLLLVLRSPIGTFTALVIPLMVLIALNVATPQVALRELQGIRYADFLAPAMATFALLNACYVNMITAVVIAREDGILKRLHGTPLPLWAYVVGRVGAAAVVGLASVVVVLGIGALFMDVRFDGARVAALAGVIGLGIATFATLGMAVSTLVPRPDTALPVAYGTMLPIAFLSDVFFPCYRCARLAPRRSGRLPALADREGRGTCFRGRRRWLADERVAADRNAVVDRGRDPGDLRRFPLAAGRITSHAVASGSPHQLGRWLPATLQLLGRRSCGGGTKATESVTAVAGRLGGAGETWPHPRGRRR